MAKKKFIWPLSLEERSNITFVKKKIHWLKIPTLPSRDDISSRAAIKDLYEVPGICVCKLCHSKNSCWSKMYVQVKESPAGFPGQNPNWTMFASDIAGNIFRHPTQCNWVCLTSKRPKIQTLKTCLTSWM